MRNFRTPAACLEALERLNPVNVAETHATLARMLESLLEDKPHPGEHLQVLEAARLPLELVQDEMSKRYAAHPLPPDSAENTTLQNVVRLWQIMRRSYAEIAQRAASDPTLAEHQPMLAQRQVAYAALAVFEYFRAHRAIPAGMWLELHRCFAAAENQGLAEARAPDPLNEAWKAQSAAEAYAAALLVDLANPYGRSKREFSWICRWAQRFAPYCGLSPASDAIKSTAYGLDLNGDHALRPFGTLPAGRSSLRCFDGTRLAEQLRSTLDQFKRGTTPAQLGLGEDCATEAGAKLLISLYRPWGLGSVGRRFRRRGASGMVKLTGNWGAIGFHLQGKPFDDPERPATPRSLRSDIHLLTFGERAEEIDAEDAIAIEESALRLGFAYESWALLDQSVGGFRLGKKPTTERLAHQQLVGVLPPDGNHLLLGQVSWLLYRDDGTMEAGINLLDGVPEAMAFRQVLPDGRREPYYLAYILPAVPALQKPASLVLPGGWFQEGRIVEQYVGKPRPLRLCQLLLRGTNFDQVTYEAASPGI